MLIAVIFSLLAAAMNASSSVLERLSMSDIRRGQLLSRHQAVANLVNRKFILGLSLQVIAFAMQALALARAPLIVVEPLLTTDLIFLLLLLRFTLGVQIKLRDWRAVVLMIAGMTGLFVAAQPRGGQLKYALLPWLICGAISAVLIISGLLVVKNVDSPRYRTAAAATAGALSFALNAAFTKLALDQLESGGLALVFTSWPLYALLASGLLSIYLLQTAYSSGPLAISQPIFEVTEPTVSVVIGILIFGDMINRTAGAIFKETISLSIVVLGIIMLATSPNIVRAGQAVTYHSGKQ